MEPLGVRGIHNPNLTFRMGKQGVCFVCWVSPWSADLIQPAPACREVEFFSLFVSFVEVFELLRVWVRVQCSDDKWRHYARRMGQPTQRATNYTARSNIDTAQIFLHANGQRPKRAMIRQRSRRRQRRGEPHTEHGLGHELPALTALAQHISHSHCGIDEKRPTEKFVQQKSAVLYLNVSSKSGMGETQYNTSWRCCI